MPGCPEPGKGPVSKTGAARLAGSNPAPGAWGQKVYIGTITALMQ